MSMASDPTEPRALVEKLIAGDEQALAEIFSLHSDRLRRMIHFRLHPKLLSRMDPDDVLQEAYLDALQRIDSYKDEVATSVFVWLRMIVTQTMVDVHRRHLGAQMRSANQEIALPQLNTTRGSSASMSCHLLGNLSTPSHAAMRKESSSQLETALDEMDDIDREVILLRHFEELDNKEVADVLGIQESAASNRYVRALIRLKGVLSNVPGFENGFPAKS